MFTADAGCVARFWGAVTRGAWSSVVVEYPVGRGLQCLCRSGVSIIVFKASLSICWGIPCVNNGILNTENVLDGFLAFSLISDKSFLVAIPSADEFVSSTLADCTSLVSTPYFGTLVDLCVKSTDFVTVVMLLEEEAFA